MVYILQVLDLGFNKLVQVPESALKNTPYLTLLALDGNPLETLPLAAFTHLNSTLRGLSIGGSHLKCDCRIRWVAQWIRKYNLQVTSRERNPKFCGDSEPLKGKLFTQIAPSELICDNETVTTTNSRTDAFLLDTSTFPLPKDLNKLSSIFVSFQDADNPSETDGNTITEEFILSSGKTPTTGTFSNLRTPSGVTKTLPPPTSVQDNINISDAYRKGSSVVIEWEPKFDNSSRVRVIYRYFGETVFHQSSVLDPSQRQYIIPDLPANSCVVVCVTTIEDISNTTRDFLHHSRCREIKYDRFKADFFFKVVTAAATSVSAVVIVALIVFVCCLCRRKKSVLPPPPTTSLPPLTLDHEWETMSIYSGRSIPRVRISYVDPAVHADKSYYNHSFLMDESRLYTSPFSHMSNIYTSVRPAVDGQSQNSYSQLSNKYGNNYCLGSPEMYKSGQHQFSDHLVGSPPRKKKPRRDCLTTAGFLHEYDNDGNVKPNDVS
ncbi:uncharacterized protein LOC143247254 [Tachypleus tridentatus]|uniref:uncharacterized protein LOC143247254 n=1 Tax=Tachypleus tridentatus TaxID=6853 RepID=UPI003FD136B4